MVSAPLSLSGSRATQWRRERNTHALRKEHREGTVLRRGQVPDPLRSAQKAACAPSRLARAAIHLPAVAKYGELHSDGRLAVIARGYALAINSSVMVIRQFGSGPTGGFRGLRRYSRWRAHSYRGGEHGAEQGQDPALPLLRYFSHAVCHGWPPCSCFAWIGLSLARKVDPPDHRLAPAVVRNPLSCPV
jgi:hypothetical protein